MAEIRSMATKPKIINKEMCVKTTKSNNFQVSKTIDGYWELLHGETVVSTFKAKSRSKKQIQFICDYLNEETINLDRTLPIENVKNAIDTLSQ